MEWFYTVALILAGILLVIAEIVLVPGVTVVGGAGLLFWLAGVVGSFLWFGPTIGSGVLGASILVGSAGFFYSLRSGSWNLLALKDKHETDKLESTPVVSVGDEGKAVSSLRPMGTAEIGSYYGEVHSQGGMISPNSRIKVVKVSGVKVYVVPV